jgi:hypothetical protein
MKISLVPLVANDGMKFGFRNPNGSFTGALKTIKSRASDVAFVGYFIKDYETRDIEFSSSLYSDELCLVTKKAERIPQYLLPLLVFNRTFWFVLGLETIFGNDSFIMFWHFVAFREKSFDKLEEFPI